MSELKRLVYNSEKLCFIDEKTGKRYLPVHNFTVTGEDLTDKFNEVNTWTCGNCGHENDDMYWICKNCT